MSSDYKTPWAGQATFGVKARSLAVGSNTSAGPAVLYHLELFYIGTDGKLYHCWQDAKQPNGWGGPALLAGAAETVAVTNLVDGNLAVFYTDANNVLHYNWQDPKKPGGWGGPTTLGGKAQLIAATSNGGGGLEVFYIGSDSQLYHQSQSQPNGAWSLIHAIAPSVSTVAATRNIDGTPVIFYIDKNTVLYTLPMVSGQQPVALADNASAPLAITSYASGGLALFYGVGIYFTKTGIELCHSYQPAPNAPWIRQNLSCTAKTATAARMVDDTMAIFLTDFNDTLLYSWPLEQQGQQVPGETLTWGTPVLLGGTRNTATSLAAACNADGRLELFYIGTDGELYHNWQVYNWQTLQNMAAVRTQGAHIIDGQPQPAPGAISDGRAFGLDPSQTPGIVTSLVVTWGEPSDIMAFLMSIEWTSAQVSGSPPVPLNSVFLRDTPDPGLTIKKATFVFLENEILSKCTLYTNSGLMAGIEFETSLGRTFSAGNLKLGGTSTIELPEVAGALLMGFYGYSNSVPFNLNDSIPEISSLGLWISKTVKAISVKNIRYDLGRAMITNQQTQSLDTIELVNNSDESQTVSEGMSYTLESSSNWSHADTTTVGVSVSLSIGYTPACEIGGPTFGLTFTGYAEQSSTDTTGGDASKSTIYSYTASATVPAHSNINVDVACTRAILSVPYVADVVVTYADGTTTRLNTSPGVYSGVQNYDIRATYTTPSGASVQQVAVT